MRHTQTSLTSLVRRVLLTEAVDPEQAFLSYAIGSDPAKGGNEKECSMRKRMIAKMINDPALKLASFSKLAEIIAKHKLFKLESTSPEEWIEATQAAWVAPQGPLKSTEAAELVKDLRKILSSSVATPPPSSAPREEERRRRRRRSVSQDELREILEMHRAYFRDPSDGKLADLTYADLRSVDLRGVDLTEAEVMHANLSGADLREANLTNAYFFGADFTNANLAGANLTKIKAPDSNLWGANLTNANLVGDHFGGTNLLYAKLQGADLRDANFKGARYSKKTTFNSGFNPKDAGMIFDA